MTDYAAIFKAGWDEALAERKRHSPSFKPEEYTATGRSSAKYGGKQTIDWWMDNGPGMVADYAAWRLATKWDIPEIDGKPGVELELLFNLPGVETPVKGFIDRVFAMPTGELAILDIKTGRQPEVAEQLGLYRVGLGLQHGLWADWGFFWTPGKGHTSPIDLRPWTPERFSIMFTNSVNAINAGYFNPNPQNNCKNWCGVARYCAAVGGEKAEGNDPLAV